VVVESDIGWLLLRLTPFKWRIALSLVCMALAGIVVTIDPMLMCSLIDSALPQRNLRWSLYLVGGIGICYLARTALYGMGSLINFSTSLDCVRDLRAALIDQLNRLSVDYHEMTPVGEKLACIEHDVDEIANFAADTVNQVIRAVLFIALNLMMMARLNLPMTLVLLPLMPLFAYVQRRFSIRFKSLADKTRFEVGAATSVLNEHLDALPQLQFLGAEAVNAKRASSVWNRMLRAQRIQRQSQIGFTLLITVVLVAAILVVLGYGSEKVLSGALTIGGLVAFYAYSNRVFEPLSSTMDLCSRLQFVGASIRRVRALLALEPTVRDTGRMRLEASKLTHGFRIEDVSFFVGSKCALSNVSFSIHAGKRVAIIGASGSGKSTLARLLVRAADPHSGSILLEENRLGSYRLSSLRSAVCFVPQHPVLLGGTIRDNLQHGNPRATSAEMDQAIQVAQLTAFLGQLPHGLDTKLGPGGTGLSGGERQRLAIARALLRNSATLILDEATSALDVPSERAVLTSITEHCRHRTFIIISHRISSLVWVDEFVLLDQGRMVAVGPHSVLYAQSVRYRAMFDTSTRDIEMP
jgi:ABC-type multidrug transport system fused ATPase/permease subunit